MGALTLVIVVLFAIWVICRYYKKRRRRQSETDQGNRTGTSRNSVNSPLLSGASGNYIDGPHLAGTSTNSFDTQLPAGISRSSVNRPLLAGTSGNLVDSPHVAGTTRNSVDGPLLPGTSGNPVDSQLLVDSSENLVGFPLLVGTYGNAADDNKVSFDVYTLENDLETDTKPVLKRLDRNRWIDRQELLKSKVSIHQLCAKRWTALDREFHVFSMSNKEVELLKKEAHSKAWTPEELNFKILSRWTQIKGNQATVQALCDALLENKHYDIIEDIMKEIP